MEEKRSWWQKASKPLGVFGIIVVCILIIALLVVIVMVYVFDVNVPGLRGKTLWDWLQLLIIPLVLAIVALLFNLANSQTERQIAKQRYEQDQQIALDKQQGDILQAYLDRMSDLLLKDKLLTSPSDEWRKVARVRTITVLTQLDGRRVGYVFAFLHEAGLISTASEDRGDYEYDINLFNFDLHAVNWRNADLSEVDLAQANLRGADLSHANLGGADLSRANLTEANLSGASLDRANLSLADLTEANLKDTIGVTVEELEKQAASLNGATMPDGSIHEYQL